MKDQEECKIDDLEELFNISKDQLNQKLKTLNSKEKEQLLKNTLIRKESNIKECLRILLQEIEAYPYSPQINLSSYVKKINRDFEIIKFINLFLNKI